MAISYSIEPASAVLTAVALIASSSGSAFAAVVRTSDAVRVGERSVRLDVYECKGGGGEPTVLLLHGVGGMLGDGPLMRRVAQAFARAGFRAVVAHYFNATGTLFTTPAKAKAQGASLWKDAIAGVAEHLAAESVDGKVALFGYSMGGFLAVGVARDLPQVSAVAVLSGGLLSEHEGSGPANLPPILILHGGKDSVVTPDRADALATFADRSDAEVVSLRYRGEGHAFSPTAERDAIARAADFLKSVAAAK